MPEVILYTAASLDGYIARADGDVDWLSAVEQPGTDYGYTNFYASVDALVMGRKTYELVAGMADWPYAGRPSYVLTRQGLRSERDDVRFTDAAPDALCEQLDREGHDRVWLVGGGEVVAAFQRRGLVHEYIVSIVPTLLGTGVPLFPRVEVETPLDLAESRLYPSGLVQLTYRPSAG